MPNAITHKAVSGIVVGVGVALWEQREKRDISWQTPTTASIAWLSGTLPDLIEPAIHPNHRQFFHSVLFGFILGTVLHKLWKWEPEEAWQKIARILAIAVAGSYLVHLAMDSLTAKSLPLIGKF